MISFGQIDRLVVLLYSLFVLSNAQGTVYTSPQEGTTLFAENIDTGPSWMIDGLSCPEGFARVTFEEENTSKLLRISNWNFNIPPQDNLLVVTFKFNVIAFNSIGSAYLELGGQRRGLTHQSWDTTNPTYNASLTGFAHADINGVSALLK